MASAGGSLFRVRVLVEEHRRVNTSWSCSRYGVREPALSLSKGCRPALGRGPSPRRSGFGRAGGRSRAPGPAPASAGRLQVRKRRNSGALHTGRTRWRENNVYSNVIDSDLTLHSAGKEAAIAGTASLIEAASLWAVLTFVPRRLALHFGCEAAASPPRIICVHLRPSAVKNLLVLFAKQRRLSDARSLPTPTMP